MHNINFFRFDMERNDLVYRKKETSLCIPMIIIWLELKNGSVETLYFQYHEYEDIQTYE